MVFTVSIKIPNDARTERNGEAFLSAWALMPGLAVSAAEGQLTIAMGELLVDECRKALRKYPTIDVFLSWPDVSGYAPKVRADLADMVRELPAVRSIHVHSIAPIVSMGLTALRLSTSVRVECYSEEVPFLTAMRRLRSITSSGPR